MRRKAAAARWASGMVERLEHELARERRPACGPRLLTRLRMPAATPFSLPRARAAGQHVEPAHRLGDRASAGRARATAGRPSRRDWRRG